MRLVPERNSTEAKDRQVTANSCYLTSEKEGVGEMVAEQTVGIVELGEMHLIGLPCVGLEDMGGKYQSAKSGLMSASKHLPGVTNSQVHWGLWPVDASQGHPDTHVFIACIEVESFEDI